ncbi:MAG: hypothetical protein LBH43_08540 [Treponema sp.]|jgi:hypothetical protein|nr:hypothetical protein [Treponema sp.]
MKCNFFPAYILFLLLFFLGGSFAAAALDIIVMLDGDMIEGKVVEISSSEVRYKSMDNLNGPTISIPRNRVLSITQTNTQTNYATAAPPRNQIARSRPQTNQDKFSLDGFNAFAVSGFYNPPYGGGATITVFEKYKPNVFFSPSYFISYKAAPNVASGDLTVSSYFDMGVGVLFKHRFPKDRVLWNLGASLDLMSVYAQSNKKYYGAEDEHDGYNPPEYLGGSLLLGMEIQTGLSFRLTPNISLDINGLLKFPFGSVEMEEFRPDYYDSDYSSKSKSYWPFSPVLEVGVTFSFPYRSRG